MDKCRICDNEKNLKLYKVRERQLNRGEKFDYMFCPVCGTLQLITPIDNMGQYYEGYYAFSSTSRRMKFPKIIVIPFLRMAMRNSYKNKYPGRIINKICFTSLNIYNTGVKFTDRVLDIGGG